MARNKRILKSISEVRKTTVSQEVSDWHTDWFTNCPREGLLDRLIVVQLVTKFLSLLATWKVISATGSYPEPDESSPHPLPFRIILIQCSHQDLRLGIGLFPSNSSNKSFRILFMPPPLNFIILTIREKSATGEAPHSRGFPRLSRTQAGKKDLHRSSAQIWSDTKWHLRFLTTVRTRLWSSGIWHRIVW